jgi:hypothetical protein
MSPSYFAVLLNFFGLFAISYVIVDFLAQLMGLARGHKFQYVFLSFRKQWRNGVPMYIILVEQVIIIFVAVLLATMLGCPMCWLCPSC